MRNTIQLVKLLRKKDLLYYWHPLFPTRNEISLFFLEPVHYHHCQINLHLHWRKTNKKIHTNHPPWTTWYWQQSSCSFQSSIYMLLFTCLVSHHKPTKSMLLCYLKVPKICFLTTILSLREPSGYIFRPPWTDTNPVCHIINLQPSHNIMWNAGKLVTWPLTCAGSICSSLFWLVLVKAFEF